MSCTVFFFNDGACADRSLKDTDSGRGGIDIIISELYLSKLSEVIAMNVSFECEHFM